MFTGLAPARGSTSSWELPSPIGVQSIGFELMTLGTTRQPKRVVLTLYLALERANKTGKSQASYWGVYDLPLWRGTLEPSPPSVKRKEIEKIVYILYKNFL